MPNPKRILITGAAGNLGASLTGYLLKHSDHHLNLMVHKKDVSAATTKHERTTIFHCDLADRRTLQEASQASDTIIHFAGVLFAPNPESFLPTTNTGYARNLIDTAAEAGVERFILISFPHVEGPTSIETPCTDRLDREPISVHAATRLATERYILAADKHPSLTGISLRAGMIYGADILMIAYARMLARRRLLGIWREPTPIHVISEDDFNACCQAAIENPDARGIYPLGDDDPLTLQEFLDLACQQWGVPAPWRVPAWSVYTVAWFCELYARVFRTLTPFTGDFIRIGQVPYYCDTSRMRQDLAPKLRFASFRDGVKTC